MQTFIYSPDERNNDQIILSGTEAKHITSVLRLGVGEVIRLIDGSGEAHTCEIAEVASKRVTCRIVKTTRNNGEAAISVTLAVGLSTASKFDSVLEKGTEVGVKRFVPLLTQKAKVKIEGKEAISKKHKRWLRVCEAAVKQSGRSLYPQIVDPQSFIKYISTCSPDKTVVFHPDSPDMTISELLRTYAHPEITVITGPESGFSKEELRLIQEMKIPVISLGDRILRTETAAVVCTSLIIYLQESFKA